MEKDAKLSMRLSAEMRSRLDNVSSRSGLSAADLVGRALEEYLDRVEKDGSITVELREEPPPYRVKKK